jgi:hypothetical protein
MNQYSYIKPLEMDLDYMNKLLKPLIKSDVIDDEYSLVDKFFALACDESTKQYNVLYLYLNNVNELGYQNVFKYSFTQDERNENIFTMAHQNANKLLVVKFEKFDGFQKKKKITHNE